MNNELCLFIYHVNHHAFLKTFTRVPMCGRISTANSSPSRILTAGSRPAPTPAGVPVMITVPGGSVVPCETKLTSFAMEKIKSLEVLAVVSKAGQGLDLRSLAVLHHIPVLQSADAKLARVRDQVLGHQGRSQRARAVEAFGEAPLGLGELACAA